MKSYRDLDVYDIENIEELITEVDSLGKQIYSLKEWIFKNRKTNSNH